MEVKKELESSGNIIDFTPSEVKKEEKKEPKEQQVLAFGNTATLEELTQPMPVLEEPEKLKNNEEINVFGHTLKPKYNECKDGFVDMSSNHINSGIIIVPDNVVDENYKAYNSIIGNYKTESVDEQRNIEETIKGLINNPLSEKYNLPTVNTRLDISEASIGLGALVTFLGLYLGIVFLIASVAILALKELTESTDNKERYKMLRKLGADEKMINKSLFRQIAIFFMFPLLVAIIHSIFGIKFILSMLAVLASPEELLPSILVTTLIIGIVYGLYFLATYFGSKNIIKEE